MGFWILRLSFILLMFVLGRQIGADLGATALCGFIGLFVGIVFVIIEMKFSKISLRGLTSGIFGAILGMLTAKIVHDVMIALQVDLIFVNRAMPVLTFIFLYVGVMFSVKKRDEFALVLPYVRFSRVDEIVTPILLDTSAILDGRVFEVIRCGFLKGKVIIPDFVIRELQKLADSQDHSKRQKGRQGLELLNGLQKDKTVQIDIYKMEISDKPVDEGLIQLAKLIGGQIVTLDYNLVKIAQLQGVVVLNLNDLILALQPKVVSGEFLQIKLVREGKDYNQAVGYTAEGTMVVVESARHLIGKVVTVEVYNSIQTSSGKIIFARLKKNGHFHRLDNKKNVTRGEGSRDG